MFLWESQDSGYCYTDLKRINMYEMHMELYCGYITIEALGLFSGHG